MKNMIQTKMRMQNANGSQTGQTSVMILNALNTEPETKKQTRNPRGNLKATETKPDC